MAAQLPEHADSAQPRIPTLDLSCGSHVRVWDSLVHDARERFACAKPAPRINERLAGKAGYAIPISLFILEK